MDLRHLIASWILAAVALMITSHFTSGFAIKNFSSALWAALVVGVAGYSIRPILFILTLPINILTLGLFTFVINGAILRIASLFVSGFAIQGWGAAIWGALVLSIVNLILDMIF